MPNHRIPIWLAVLVATILTVGCKSKGPAPGDALTQREDVIMAEREGAPSGLQKLGIPKKEYERDYRSVPHDPHGPAGHLNPPDSHVSGDVKHIDVGGLTFNRPDGWLYEHPTSAMRRAELGVRGDGGPSSGARIGRVPGRPATYMRGNLAPPVESWLPGWRMNRASGCWLANQLPTLCSGSD